MNEPHLPAAPRELRPRAPGGFGDWLLGLVGRGAPRARVAAAPAVRLGGTLEATWRLDWGAREITNVSVALVGAEVARQRLSARTGISTVTETRPFITVSIDRQMPARGAAGAGGRGTVTLPIGAPPTVTGRLNEIAWSVVVEAARQADVVWRGEFALTVLPLERR